MKKRPSKKQLYYRLMVLRLRCRHYLNPHKCLKLMALKDKNYEIDDPLWPNKVPESCPLPAWPSVSQSDIDYFCGEMETLLTHKCVKGSAQRFDEESYLKWLFEKIGLVKSTNNLKNQSISMTEISKEQIAEMRAWLNSLRPTHPYKNDYLEQQREGMIDAILAALAERTEERGGVNEEWRREILSWIDGKMPTLRFISENNTSQDARYHANRDIIFFSKIRALIAGSRGGAVTEEERKKLLDWLHTLRCSKEISCNKCKDGETCIKNFNAVGGLILGSRDGAVTEEFVEKWVKKWMQDDADFIKRELTMMLHEAGVAGREEK